ncbi:hypothetical protein MMC13_005244 [Lambiella insularis]|nr:hypothetical protein [Lambiella insularis]
MIDIDAQGDLVVRVVEYENALSGSPRQKPPVRQIVDFKVRKEVLVKSSTYFRTMFSAGQYSEATQDPITLEEDRTICMEVWFRRLHNSMVAIPHNLTLEEIWHLLAACNKYDLVVTDLKDWFATWYGNQNVTDLEMEQLLYPCFMFDHPIGFALSTKYLVYNGSGHLTEENPTQYRRLHLDSLVIQQLNAAKGRLRIILHGGLFRPIDSLLDARCECSAKVLKMYEGRLKSMGVWPLEKVARRSIQSILNILESFTWTPPPIDCNGVCKKDYTSAVQEARSGTKIYFGGLCLDCMDSSKPKTGDAHEDYWRHGNLSESEWVRGCRMGPHPQSTWYFSFMGRRQHMEQFRKNNRLKRHFDDF